MVMSKMIRLTTVFGCRRQVRPIHVGRWVCSVHISLLHERLVSRPASVALATLSARSQHPVIVAGPSNASVPPGGTAGLACRANTEVRMGDKADENRLCCLGNILFQFTAFLLN